ncbi:MAG: sugar isomerase domain-containing protein [Erysipelotrichaceae bacterium]|nr:sugar isomerase domain-containing protein [Erysipelotrichaceae bacterium]MBQ1788263.1 sugar isomerase domain-containing protein [Erysipelotrichaceae bacterium]MBQ5805212.1 sugar isomerase domain-containing protein [Erysipelotrichaceae bacterium]
MDIKKAYFELIKDRVSDAYEKQRDQIKAVAEMFSSCMENMGVVQLFGVRHGEEFVNELNYRAGGIAPFHGLKLKELVLKELLKQDEIDSGEVYSDLSVIDKFARIYDLDDRDMYCLVSFYGNEPLIVELARRAKEKGQKVVAVVNRKSYDKYGGKLLDYADLYLDMDADEPDLALDIDGVKTGQLSSTVCNVIAQMITAEVYNSFVSKGKEAPVLLSANIKGADIHNNSLTDPYGRRVR